MDRRVLLPSRDALLPILSGAYFARVQDSLPTCPFLPELKRTGRDQRASDGRLILRQCRHSREGQ